MNILIKLHASSQIELAQVALGYAHMAARGRVAKEMQLKVSRSTSVNSTTKRYGWVFASRRMH